MRKAMTNTRKAMTNMRRAMSTRAVTTIEHLHD
jgi:hypothetical protein